MGKFKGKKALSMAIHNTIKRNIGVSPSVRFGAEFESYYEINKISYTLVYEKISSGFFKEFFEICLDFDFTDDFEFEVFTLSVLHEIGHLKTMKKFSEKEIEKDFEKKDEMNDWSMYAKRTHFTYFALPTEIAASRWAVKWAKKHPKKFIALKEDIKKAVYNFYKTNNLELDDSVFQ